MPSITENPSKKACLIAVNLGNDADTTGAIFGKLAGAIYGEDSIPDSWSGKITNKYLILEIAGRLLL
jgi:ADP-ribosyl-[dinitrogen reductase] hydrolase